VIPAAGEARVESVRRALAAVARRDLPALLDLVDPGVELRPLQSVWRQTYRGREGLEKWWSDVAALWDEFSVDLEDVRDLDGALLLQLHWRGRAQGAASELDGPAAAVVRFRDDKIVLLDLHIDQAHALGSLPRP
jgi:ketosteroid isomerase-like protein